jgi:cyclomaltodextrinase
MWWKNAQIYHIYPLGFCGSPRINQASGPGENHFPLLLQQVQKAQELGMNTILLGPVFQSHGHGYETIDYFTVDYRLGSNADFLAFLRSVNELGLRVVLDGVYNHVGRGFAPFQDLLHRREASPYKDWFQGINFHSNNPFNDGLDYATWEGHYELVKLNHSNPEVRSILLSAMSHWAETGLVHGYRFDASDVLPADFRQFVSQELKGRFPDLWLMGEVIHGDYRHWAGSTGFHSTTNYELYKGLWSSFNDANFFEVCYSLNRQFGPGGLYQELDLCNFLDNHDVNRIASTLQDPRHLYPIHGLLFTLPGMPSIYYGSESGLKGTKAGDDWPLRPDYGTVKACDQGGELENWIGELAALRERHPALRQGQFQALFNDHTLMGFLRKDGTEDIMVWINAEDRPRALEGRHLPQGIWENCFTGEEIAPGIEVPAFGTGVYRLLGGL